MELACECSSRFVYNEHARFIGFCIKFYNKSKLFIANNTLTKHGVKITTKHPIHQIKWLKQVIFLLIFFFWFSTLSSTTLFKLFGNVIGKVQ
jgi:hypothetical protein